MIYPVTDGDVLKKETTFTLSREWENLVITVVHFLAGPKAGAFSATATFDEQLINSDFWGYGASETAALRDLLTKIHGRPFAELLTQ